MEDFRLSQLPGRQGTEIGPLYAQQCGGMLHFYCYMRDNEMPNNLTGIKTRIESWGSNNEPKLCGELQGETAPAATAAWTGITLVEPGVGAVKSAQMGYHRSRGYVPGVPPTQIVKRVFAETKYGPGPTDINIFSPPDAILGAGNLWYLCEFVNPTFGTWYYLHPEPQILFHFHSSAGWSGVYGNTRRFTAEVWNYYDNLVGIEVNKVRWDMCEFEVGGSGYEPVDFLNVWTPQSDVATQWGIQVLNGQAFEVWDRFP